MLTGNHCVCRCKADTTAGPCNPLSGMRSFFSRSTGRYDVWCRGRGSSGGNAPPGGFTLLEVLVSIVIFAIVLTAIYTTFNTTTSHSAAIDGSLGDHAMGLSCLNRMSIDLQSLYVTAEELYRKPGFTDPPDPFRFLAAADTIGGTSFPRLEFASQAHLASTAGVPRRGIALITYHVTAAADGGFILRRGDRIIPEGPETDPLRNPILCEGLRGLSFVLYDDENDAYDVWDSDSDDVGHATPTAVRIRIEIDASPKPIQLETLIRLPVQRSKKT